MNGKSKRAIVTGGSRGIGRAIVKELAAKVCSGVLLSDIAFINDNSEECAAELEREIGSPDTKIYAFRADVTSSEDAQKTVDEAVKWMGELIYW